MISTWIPCLILILAELIQRSISVDVYHSPQDFCYDTKKKCSSWRKTCRTGTRQSPIDLTIPKGQELAPAVHIPMTHFKDDHFYLQNNGHTVKVDFTPAIGKESHIFPGYGLSTTKYRFANAHFHWGNKDSEGSEHTLYGKTYSMEMHLVHYNMKYPTLKKAVDSGDRNALAVVGILFQADGSKPNPALVPIIANLEEIRHKHKYYLKVEEPLDLTSLIPTKNAKMFSYQGSLTTPTCNEQVNWYVFEKPVSISRSDIKAFRIIGGRNATIKNNNRPIQKLNGRKIELFLLK